MELTDEEIGYVKFFIHKKKYFYFEVQSEVMDHFLSLLEDEKPKDTSLVFSDLVEQVYLEHSKELNSIQNSLSKRLQQKYNSIFFKNALTPLKPKYLILIILGGIAIFNLQLFLQNYISFAVFYLLFSIVSLIILFKYSPPSDALIGNYLANKIAGNYGYVLYVFSSFVFIFIYNGRPVILPTGFNITCLVATIGIIIKFLYVNAMIKTAWVGVNECMALERKSEILIG
jgi:hypothetical protein